MRLEVTQAVAAPPEAVFARLADFPGFEARARRRRIPVKRLSDDPPAWHIGVDWHGFSQEVELHVVWIRPPEGYEAALATRGLDGTARVTVVPAPGGSRLTVALEVGSRGFAGRLVLQTLAFARPALEARLKGALARLAAEVEAGSARPPGGA